MYKKRIERRKSGKELRAAWEAGAKASHKDANPHELGSDLYNHWESGRIESFYASLYDDPEGYITRMPESPGRLAFYLTLGICILAIVLV